jgi:hypothetical protein
MKEYSFLVKPVFFIFNLIFATWLVLSIEKIKPSDFGEYNTIFAPAPKPRMVGKQDKVYLKKLAEEYCAGKIDGKKLDEELERFVAPVQ